MWASFLLCWWNAEECGKFDITDMWNVDDATVDDMFTILRMTARLPNRYPDSLGYGELFEHVVRTNLGSKPTA